LFLAASGLSAAMVLAQSASPPLDARPPGPAQESLTAAQLAKVKAVLAPFKGKTLTTEDAKALKRALRDAGMRRGPALDAAVAAEGFSAERMEALDPRPAGASAPPPMPVR
jgi:hypothetical protein